MISFFRSFFQSKFGVGITLAFLALIAFAFASSDVANTGTFGGVSGGDRVAIVGDTKISTSDLSKAASAALDQARQSNPTLTMDVFIAEGGLEQVLERLIQRTAIAEFGKNNGFRAGSRLIDSEIVQIPSFRGADGNFDQEAFRQMLAQQRISEADVREDIGLGLFARQVLLPANFGTAMPGKLAKRYASLFKEKRTGALGLLPSAVFMPKDDPSDAVLKKFYDAQRSDFIRPERRVIRYATFSDDVLKDLRAPTDAEIAARYERDKAQYTAKEERRFTQLVVPTQAAARAILDQVAQGTSLSAAAQAQGLQTVQTEMLTRSALANQSSAAVAAAAFTARKGTIATPARGGLGFYVLRVDDVKSTPGRTLAQVRGEIAETLTTEQRRAALSDMSAEIEDRFGDGAALSEVAAEVGAEVKTTRQLTADGKVYGEREATAPEILARALSTAFSMDENEPQLAEIEPGKTFLLFDVSSITESAAAPLSEIKEQVAARWKLAQGLEASKKAADRVMERVRKGATLSKALAEEENRLPPADQLSLGRQDLAQMGRRVPPPIALFFSMAEKTVKRLEAPQEQGWFVVSLQDIEVGEIADDDPLIAGSQQQLGQVLGNEYADALSRAILAEVGVEKNDAAIEAVKQQLTGGQ